MITKDVALERIKECEAKTVDCSFPENVQKKKNELFDTLSRVIWAINPKEHETIEAVVDIARITKHYVYIAWEKEYTEEEMKDWFADMNVILDRILMDARPPLV